MDASSKAAEGRGNGPQSSHNPPPGGGPGTTRGRSTAGGHGGPERAPQARSGHGVLPGWDPRKGGELFDDGDDEPELDPSQLRPPTEEDLLGLEADLDMALEDYGFGYRRCSKLIRQVTGLRVNPTLLWRFRRRRQRERQAEQQKLEASPAAAEAGASGVASAGAKADREGGCVGTPEVEGLELAQRMVFEAMQARFREMNVCSAIEVKDLVSMMMRVEGMALKRRMTAVAEEKVALARAKEARAARREERQLQAEAREEAERAEARRREARGRRSHAEEPPGGGESGEPSVKAGQGWSRFEGAAEPPERFTMTNDRVSSAVPQPAGQAGSLAVGGAGVAPTGPQAGSSAAESEGGRQGAVTLSHAQSRLKEVKRAPVPSTVQPIANHRLAGEIRAPERVARSGDGVSPSVSRPAGAPRSPDAARGGQ